MASGTENAYSLLAGGVSDVEAQADALDGDDLRAERRPASSSMVWGIVDRDYVQAQGAGVSRNGLDHVRRRVGSLIRTTELSRR